MRIMIVDDDSGIRWLLSRILIDEGFDVIEAGTLAEAAKHPAIDLVFLDVFLPDGNGMEALSQSMFSAPVIMMTAETTFDQAAQAYQAGVMEYLPKPFDVNEVRQLARRIQSELSSSTKKEHKIKASPSRTLIIGRSPAMQQLFRTLGKVAPSDLTVLITGESGTGKELVAQELHARSHRANAPFVAINTAAIPAELLEAELFGHEKGAFTGADKARQGRFAQAHGGTLFLDEIGDMPAALQSKLLRVLETGSIQPVGSTRESTVNVRLLAATHQDLLEKIHAGLFREDLYYRLNVIPVHIPPLRERLDDIAELAEFCLAQVAGELAIDTPVLQQDAKELLKHHRWDGNVRELKNVMRRLAVLTPGISISKTDVALALGNGHQEAGSNHASGELEKVILRTVQDYVNHSGHAEITQLHQHVLARVEQPLLQIVMENCGGNQLKASKMLGLNRNTVRKLLRQYHIDPADYQP